MKRSDDQEFVNNTEQETQKQDISEQLFSAYHQISNEFDGDRIPDGLTLDASEDGSDSIPDDLMLDISDDDMNPAPDGLTLETSDDGSDLKPDGHDTAGDEHDGAISEDKEEAGNSASDEFTEDIEATVADIGFSSEENDIIENVKEKKESTKIVDQLFDLIEMAVFTIVAVFIITTFFFKYSIVKGSSMESTLVDGDKLLLYNFLYEPECGDIVVLQDNITTGLDHAIVKRVIATGGQTVKVTATQIYVDGIPLYEKYVYTADNTNLAGVPTQYFYNVTPAQSIMPIVTDEKTGEYYEITVPEGEIFVMGDHRNNSDDSRKFGTFNEDAVLGKAILRLFPFEKID